MEKKDKSDAKKEGTDRMSSCCGPDMKKRIESFCTPEMTERMKAFMESDDFKKKMRSCCCGFDKYAKDSKETGEDEAAG